MFKYKIELIVTDAIIECSGSQHVSHDTFGNSIYAILHITYLHYDSQRRKITVMM